MLLVAGLWVVVTARLQPWHDKFVFGDNGSLTQPFRRSHQCIECSHRDHRWHSRRRQRLQQPGYLPGYRHFGFIQNPSTSSASLSVDSTNPLLRPMFNQRATLLYISAWSNGRMAEIPSRSASCLHSPLSRISLFFFLFPFSRVLIEDAARDVFGEAGGLELVLTDLP